MKSEIKKLWIDALRSEKYKQGTHRLRSSDNEYCCLGVLCDLHRRRMKKKGWVSNIDMGLKSYLGQTAYLPETVRKWAGLDKNSPFVGHQVLTGMNDSGISFKDISDTIERYL